MDMRKTPAFELYNMDRPDPFNETMTFRTLEKAQTAQRNYGGQIRDTFVHIQGEAF